MLELLRMSNTLLNKGSKAKSKVSKLVFVAFMQHCIQSNVTHVIGAEGVLCIQWLLTPPERRLFEI